MKLMLSDKWGIKTDSRQYILFFIDENGRETADSYFSHLDSCIESYADKRLRLSDAKGIAEVKEYIKNLSAELCKVLQGTKIEVTIK